MVNKIIGVKYVPFYIFVFNLAKDYDRGHTQAKLLSLFISVIYAL